MSSMVSGPYRDLDLMGLLEITVCFKQPFSDGGRTTDSNMGGWHHTYPDAVWSRNSLAKSKRLTNIEFEFALTFCSWKFSNSAFINSSLSAESIVDQLLGALRLVSSRSETFPTCAPTLNATLTASTASGSRAVKESAHAIAEAAIKPTHIPRRRASGPSYAGDGRYSVGWFSKWLEIWLAWTQSNEQDCCLLYKVCQLR